MIHPEIIKGTIPSFTLEEILFYADPDVVSAGKNFTFRTFISIAKQIYVSEESIDSLDVTLGEVLSNEIFAYKTHVPDPLLALVGTLECDITGIETHHNDIERIERAKIRVVEGEHRDNPDPLIALLGTLECDVTDIGERHDDYIGDTLLAELWRDEDE